MQVKEIIMNAIAKKTDLNFDFDFITFDINKPFEAKEIIGIRVILTNVDIPYADFATGRSERIGQLVKPFAELMFPDDSAELKYVLEIGHLTTPIVYSKKYNAIGLVLDPKKTIESIIEIPKDYQGWFVGTAADRVIMIPCQLVQKIDEADDENSTLYRQRLRCASAIELKKIAQDTVIFTSKGWIPYTQFQEERM